MRKVALAVGIAGLVAAAPSVAFGGGKPDRASVSDSDNSFDFPPGVVCSFEVIGTPLANNETTATFPVQANGDARQIVSGALKEEITNASTGNSIVVNISGPGTIINHPDGSASADTHGRNLLISFSTDIPAGPSLGLVSGHLVAEYSSGGLQTLITQTGTEEDLCAALS
jgi:hypothetical protein